jgi:hypothetical protein
LAWSASWRTRVFLVVARILAMAGKIWPWVTRRMVAGSVSNCLPVSVRQCRHEALLLWGGLVGQGDVQFRGDLAAGGVKRRVSDGQVLPGGADGVGGALLQGHLSGGELPRSGGADLDNEVAVGLAERAVRGVGDHAGRITGHVLHPEHARVGEGGEGRAQRAAHEDGSDRAAWEGHGASWCG